MKAVRHLLGLLVLATLASAAQATDCPRIISQSPYITRALAWLDRADCIVGVSRHDRLPLPQTGGVIDPDGKAIEDLEPDVVIYSNWTKTETIKSVTPKKRESSAGGWLSRHVGRQGDAT